MSPVLNAQQQVVGWKHGEVLYNHRGDVCAFVRAAEVFTFGTPHIGRFENGRFQDRAGRVVGSLGAGRGTDSPRPHRRRRCLVAPWLCLSLPASRRAGVPRPWAIWDGCRPVPPGHHAA